MRVVIVGIGDIGHDIAENLTRKHEPEVVLIDVNQDRCEELAASLDALVLHGDGTNPEMLRKARASEADALIATTNADATNMVIAMLAHRMGVPKIMVKLNDVALRAACREIGVTNIVAPKVAAAAEMLAALYGFDKLDFSLVVRGGLRMVELSADTVKGKRVTELELPEGALVVGVWRAQEVLLPKHNLRLEEDDVLLTLVESESVYEKIKDLLANGGSG